MFVLNNIATIQAFLQQGSLTLGNDFSLVVGPLTRNIEATNSISLKGVASIFSYSKTKGLFVGVSLEGLAIIEQRKATKKLYSQQFIVA